MTKNSRPFGNAPREVIMIDPITNKKLKKFPSVSEASKNFDDKYARVKITYCCQEKQQTACGFKWEYAN